MLFCQFHHFLGRWSLWNFFCKKGIALREQLNPQIDSPPPKPEALAQAIAKASPAAKQVILGDAWKVRGEFWKTGKKRMERTIPIFEALIEGDPQKDHRYHGNLGWALKDSEVPDYPRAEKELSNAIRLRDLDGDSGWLFYEANRAICRIEMLATPNLATGLTKKDVIRDLRAAASMEDFETIFVTDKATISDWLTANHLTVAKLREPEPED